MSGRCIEALGGGGGDETGSVASTPVVAAEGAAGTAAGAGVDEYGAGWPADGVYRAAIAEEKEIVAQFFPVHNSIHSYD